MNDSNRFPDSAFDRIGAYLPADQRASYFRYVAHLRTLNPKDELLILAEGMAVFTCISRQLPEALADEREKLLTEFAKLCAKHESSTANATADVRAMFAAQQKLLEQNVANWQNREQHAAHSLDRIAKLVPAPRLAPGWWALASLTSGRCGTASRGVRRGCKDWPPARW